MADEPVSPTVLTPGLPRDVVTICLRCLAKDPARRYATAAELADDLRRYLEGKAIVARPVGGVERATKWVKRNPVVTGATVAVVAALAVGTVVSLVMYRDAKAQERIAIGKVSEAETARTAEAARVTERDTALDDARYQLGLGNFLLASAAYQSRDMRLARERLDKVPAGQRGWEWYYLRRQAEGGLFTLCGHTGPVTDVGFSPDGSRMVTGSDDGTARVWDARTGSRCWR